MVVLESTENSDTLDEFRNSFDGSDILDRLSSDELEQCLTNIRFATALLADAGLLE